MSSEIQPFQGAGIDLSVYKPEKYNLLVPTVTAVQVNPLYRIRLVEVRADPNPTGGDVFKVGSRTEKGITIELFSPQKSLLERVANAAGLIFHPTECRLVKRTPRYAYYYAVGARRTASGEWAVAPGSKEIDLDVVEDELRLQYEGKCDDAGYDAPKKYKGQWGTETKEKKSGETYEKNHYVIAPEDRQRYVEDMLRANMIQWRKNLVHRAETGAKLRVIRSLTGMKSTYTAEELKKPFVIATVDFSPDYRDQQVKNLAIRQGLQAMGTLYGGVPATIPMTIFEDAVELPEVPDEDDDVAHVVDATPRVDRTQSRQAQEEDPPPDDPQEESEDDGRQEKHTESSSKQEQKDTGPAKCQHEGCGRTVSAAEKAYSEKKCDGHYCMSHQRFHLKAGG